MHMLQQLTIHLETSSAPRYPCPKLWRNRNTHRSIHPQAPAIHRFPTRQRIAVLPGSREIGFRHLQLPRIIPKFPTRLLIRLRPSGVEAQYLITPQVAVEL